MAVTCDRCLSGGHRRCRGCACTTCAVPVRPVRVRKPRPPRPRAAPRSAGVPGRKGPAPITEAEEAEIRTMVLQLVERIAAKVRV